MKLDTTPPRSISKPRAAPTSFRSTARTLLAAAVALTGIAHGLQPASDSESDELPRAHRALLTTGIDARWIECGDPSGEAGLFLHGYTDTSRSFAPTMRALERLRPDSPRRRALRWAPGSAPCAHSSGTTTASDSPN